MKKVLTTIHLGEKEARLFLEFMKHQNHLGKLLDPSFVGSITFHKDGKIRVVETKTVERFQ